MLVIYLRGEASENDKRRQMTNSMNSQNNVHPSTSTQDFQSEIHTPIVDTVYSCEICDKKFEEKQGLQKHYSFHIVRKPFLCKRCDSSFMRESALTMHRCPADEQPITVHSEVPQQISIMEAERLKPKSEKPYVCEVCEVEFLFKSNLKMHLKKNKCTTAYNCALCRCNFKQLNSLARHNNKVHLGVDLKEENDGKFQPDLPHSCKVGRMKFSKNKYLTEHLPMHKSEKVFTEFQKNLEKEERLVKNDKREVSKKPNKCEICGQMFTKNYDILRHMSTHSGEKAFKCTVCGKHYTSKSTLLVHKRRFHSSTRPFACNICPKVFLRKSELDTHSFIHKEQKPYTSADSNTGFCHRKSLESHNHLQACLGASPITSIESIDEVKDDSSKEESSALFSSGNSSESGNFDWSQPEIRRTRSRTALITQQKAKVKAFKKGNKHLDLRSYEHSSESKNDSQDLQKMPLLIGEPNSIQQNHSGLRKRRRVSNVSDSKTNHPTINADVSSADEVSKDFSCAPCPKSFKSKQGLLKRYSLLNQENNSKQKIKKELKPYECCTCGKSFKLKRDLSAHFEVHNPVQDYLCVDCNLSFNDEYDFSSHACKVYKPKINVQTFEKSHANQEKQNKRVRMLQDDLFVCSMCSKSFKLEKDLKYHLSSHSINKGFFCDMCPEAFYLEKDLKNHVLSHSKKHSFVCKMCLAEFYFTKDLEIHLTTHWSSGFICKHCHVGFDSEGDLEIHVDICSSKNNFVCDVCQKSFLLRCALVSHAKTHERKPLSCKFCGRSFNKNSLHRRHLLRCHSGMKNKKDTT